MRKVHVCNHKWYLQSFGGDNIQFRCSKCHMYATRPITASDKKEIQHYWSMCHKEMKTLFRDWFSFIKKFRDSKTLKWKLSGYVFMRAAEKWAKKHPAVQLVSVDDDFATSSLLVIIPSQIVENGKVICHHNVEMVFISQNGDAGGYPGSIIGLYPHAQRDIIKALSKIKIPRNYDNNETPNLPVMPEKLTFSLKHKHK